MPHLLTAFWGWKTFCVITGASQGIGRQLSIEIGRNVGEQSLILLLARSVPGMTETRRLVQDINPNINVVLHSVDLIKADPEEFSHFISSALTDFKVEPKDFDLAMVVHNAASVGDVSQKASEMSDPQKWLDYLSLNIVSVTCLNSVFLQIFPKDSVKEICVINITSLCGIQPIKSMGYYCVGKASREMFFRVLAEESPWLNVLSYSPGPVDTDMVTEAINNLGDPEVKQKFVDFKEKETILSPEQTTKKCVAVLAGRKYQSGGRVDYFDD